MVEGPVEKAKIKLHKKEKNITTNGGGKKYRPLH